MWKRKWECLVFMDEGFVNTQRIVFNELNMWLDRFNRDDVRYQLVSELPRVESVVDRRSLFLMLTFVEGYLFDFKFYTCISGVWVLVDTTVGIVDYLGKVE